MKYPAIQILTNITRVIACLMLVASVVMIISGVATFIITAETITAISIFSASIMLMFSGTILLAMSESVKIVLDIEKNTQSMERILKVLLDIEQNTRISADTIKKWSGL